MNMLKRYTEEVRQMPAECFSIGLHILIKFSVILEDGDGSSAYDGIIVINGYTILF
jgi:hypothetical protein